MNWDIALEIFGYVGSILVVVSMMMTSLKYLRILNISGSVISTTYSIIVGAWPIVVMNISIMAINFYHLFRKAKARKIHAGASVPNDLCESPEEKETL